MANFNTLRPLRDTILFQFLDKVGGSKGAFEERTRSGLVIPKLTSTQKGERWGKVVAVGPDIEDQVQVGEYVLIEALMWFKGIRFENENLWKTTGEKVMIVTSDESKTVSW